MLDFSTLSGENLQSLTPKRCDERSRHFYKDFPPGQRKRAGNLFH